MIWYVYIIQSEKDGSLYTGISKDPIRRLEEHNSNKKGAKRTRGRGPWRLLAFKLFESRGEALKEEYSLKHKPKSYKFLWCSQSKNDG
jgi:putative endonuclease